jgi:hypothetical protein
MSIQTTNTSVIDTDNNKERLSKLKTQYDPIDIEREATKDLDSFTGNKVAPESPIFKALTLNEFDNGMLMTFALPEQLKTFAIDMSRKLQKEYDCGTISENATCELAALSYSRMLEAQRRITLVLAQGTTTELLNQFLATMSKELDRATRHYFSAIQTLRMMKQAPLNITIRAQTAIVGQNQIVQTKNLYE